MSLYCFILFIFLTIFRQISPKFKFNIPDDHDKCYVSHVYIPCNIQIQYEINGFDERFVSDSTKGIVGNDINIFVKKEGDERVIKEEKGIKSKNNFVVHLTDPGRYFICVRFFPSNFMPSLPNFVTISLEIREDSSILPTSQFMTKNEVLDFSEKIKEIKSQTFININKENEQMMEEKRIQKEIISSGFLYNILTVIQIIIICGIGFFNIHNFLKYLKRKEIV